MNIEFIVSIVIISALTSALGYLISRTRANNAISRLQLQNDQQLQKMTDLENQLNEQLKSLELTNTSLIEANKNLALAKQSTESVEAQLSKSQDEDKQREIKVAQLQTSLSDKEQSYSSVQASLDAELKNASTRMVEITTLKAELKQATRTLGEVQTENARLSTTQSKNEEHHAKQLAQFEEQKAALKVEFEHLANNIFETKGLAFTEKNKASLDELLNPFKIQMSEFRKKVEDIHHKDTQQQTELKTELKQLQSLNLKITEEAHDLATALKGQKKMQGNWGEMILENVLDRSGLVNGKDYKREVSINTEDGRGRPDAIIYLPDNKHLIIDAKVSLNAYTRYINAEDGIEREQALKEHVSAVADRIKELSDRNYYNLPGLKSPEVVFMFIPIESAFVEAMKADESVFQKALELNVLVATPTTLLTSLNIVRQLWRYEDQNKHTAELADKASKVYDKLRSFVSSMDGVGSALDRARISYDKAYGQLTAGKGNLIKQASEFKQLGVSVKNDLPEQLVDKAELELNHQALLEGSQENN